MAICLQIDTGTRNRPEGGMPATEYCARAGEVESNPCPARRRRGKRALLVWAVRCDPGSTRISPCLTLFQQNLGFL